MSHQTDEYSGDQASSFIKNASFTNSPDAKLVVRFSNMAKSKCSNYTVLELGCGDGQLIEELITINPPPKKIIGVDLSQDLILKANEKTHLRENHLCELVCDDMDSLLINRPSYHSKFDMIVSNFALHYTKNIQSLTKQLFNLLKPKGHALFTFNAIRPKDKSSTHWNTKISIDLNGVILQNPARSIFEYQLAFADAGFTLEDEYSIDGNYKIVGYNAKLGKVSQEGFKLNPSIYSKDQKLVIDWRAYTLKYSK